MSTAVIVSILLAFFALTALLSRAASRSGSIRPMSAHVLEDHDAYRAQHDLDAIRTRFERDSRKCAQ